MSEEEFPEFPEIDESEFPSEDNNFGQDNNQKEGDEENIKSIWMITCFDSKTNEVIQLNNAVFDSQNAALFQLQEIMKLCPPVNLMYDIKEIPIRTMEGFL